MGIWQITETFCHPTKVNAKAKIQQANEYTKRELAACSLFFSCFAHSHFFFKQQCQDNALTRKKLIFVFYSYFYIV